MKRLIHTAVLAAALAFALLLCGCSGAETSHKAPQRAAVESGERQFAQPSRCALPGRCPHGGTEFCGPGPQWLL